MMNQPEEIGMDQHSVRELAGALEGSRVLILGDVILDEYVWGQVQRISPEAPIPVVDVRERTYRPGGAANVAANVAALGGRAFLASVMGRDPSGEKLLAALTEKGVHCGGLLADPRRVTTTKSRVMAQHQQVVRLDSEQRTRLTEDLEDSLLAWVEDNLPQSDACVLSDYAKGIVTPRLAQQFIQLARQAGKPIVVDPKGKDFEIYHGATVVKPNLHEAERAVNYSLEDRASVLRAGRQLGRLLKGTTLLLTCGIQGMFLFKPGESPIHLPTRAHQVFDVTGAGDTVVSVLALSLAAGFPLDEAVHLANLAAGIVVTKIGTATLTLDELRGVANVNPDVLACRLPASAGLSST
jgi:rfaE bifunctional protein kinase chain/domain